MGAGPVWRRTCDQPQRAADGVSSLLRMRIRQWTSLAAKRLVALESHPWWEAFCVSTPTFGDYDAFAAWSGTSRPWGPDGNWQVWLGHQVVGGLVEVIERRLRTPSGYREAAPAALGCVPWFTHEEIADRLARLSACCVVVDKGARVLPERLVTADNGFPNVLPGLR